MKRELTSAQWELVAENYHLVGDYLERNQYPEYPFYDVVFDALKTAARVYDERPELHRYRFSTIARNKMDDAVRAEKRKYARRCAVMEVVSLDADFPAREGYSQLDRLSRSSDVEDDVSERLLYAQMISALTEKQAQVFVLKQAGFTYKEMAERCGIGYGGVNSRLYRMRGKLRSLLCALEWA